MTYLIILVIDHIPGLHVRISEEGEILGVDEAEVSTRAPIRYSVAHPCFAHPQLGEASYDYVSLSRDLEYPDEHAEFMAGGSSAPSHGSREKLDKEAPAPEVVIG